MEEYDEDRGWDDGDAESPLGEDQEALVEHIQQECIEKFSSLDFIMEPGIFAQLKRYFQAGGNPEQVVDLLLENYQAVAQTANLLAEWLIMAGMKITEVSCTSHNKNVSYQGRFPYGCSQAQRFA